MTDYVDDISEYPDIKKTIETVQNQCLLGLWDHFEKAAVLVTGFYRAKQEGHENRDKLMNVLYYLDSFYKGSSRILEIAHRRGVAIGQYYQRLILRDTLLNKDLSTTQSPAGSCLRSFDVFSACLPNYAGPSKPRIKRRRANHKCCRRIPLPAKRCRYQASTPDCMSLDPNHLSSHHHAFNQNASNNVREINAINGCFDFSDITSELPSEWPFNSVAFPAFTDASSTTQLDIYPHMKRPDTVDVADDGADDDTTYHPNAFIANLRKRTLSDSTDAGCDTLNGALHLSNLIGPLSRFRLDNCPSKRQRLEFESDFDNGIAQVDYS